MGSAAGGNTRVQSGGSMANETIVRIFDRNKHLHSAKVNYALGIPGNSRGTARTALSGGHQCHVVKLVRPRVWTSDAGARLDEPLDA